MLPITTTTQVPCVYSFLWVLSETNSFYIPVLCQRKISQSGDWESAIHVPCGNVTLVHFGNQKILCGVFLEPQMYGA